VRFELPEKYRSLPIVELALHTLASPPLEIDKIGDSDVFIPVPVQVAINEGEESVITVAGESVYASEAVSLIALEPRSGEMLGSVRAADFNGVGSWARSLPRGSIVVGAAADRGTSGSSETAAVKTIAAGSVLAGPGSHRAFVGLVGGDRGAAVVKTDDRSVSLSLGSPIVSAYSRFVLEEALVNEQPLKRLES
jgi:hypothetical protein